ncbi:MAG: hypothetical protein ACQES9_04425 [Myxococcota bacterium]
MKFLVLVSFGIIICSCSNNKKDNSEENKDSIPAEQNSEQFSDDLSIEERNRIISEREKRTEQKTKTGEEQFKNKARILRKLKSKQSREALSQRKTDFKNKKKGFVYAAFSKTEKASVKSALRECPGIKDKKITVIINQKGKALIPPGSKFKPKLKKCLQGKLSGMSFFEGQPRKTIISTR